jgi:hypothetical protein
MVSLRPHKTLFQKTQKTSLTRKGTKERQFNLKESILKAEM